METLYNIDRWLFILGNSSCANSIFDAVFPVLSSNAAMLPLYALALAGAIWHNWRKGLSILALLLVAVLITDQSIIHIKDFFGRERPCNVIHGVRLLVECGTGKSFPSAHAANNFAAAVLVSMMYPRMQGLVVSLAALIAFSRVYCGVHYPFDICAGGVYGTLIGWGIWRTDKAFRQQRI